MTRNHHNPELTPAAGTPHDVAAARQGLIAFARAMARRQAITDHLAAIGEPNNEQARRDLYEVLQRSPE